MGNPLCATDCPHFFFRKEAILNVMIWGPLKIILIARICLLVFLLDFLAKFVWPIFNRRLSPRQDQESKNKICFLDFSGKQVAAI